VEDCVGNVGADFVGDDNGGPLFHANDGLVDLVDAVGFILCVGASGDGWEHGELVDGLDICNGFHFIEDRHDGGCVGGPDAG